MKIEYTLTDLKSKQPKTPHVDEVEERIQGGAVDTHLKLDLNKNHNDSITRPYCLEASAQQRI